MSVQFSVNEQSVICRTCLKYLNNTGFTYLDDENGYITNVGNIREMLQFCIPELDLYVSSDPVICYQCLPTLVQVYNFKIKCLNGESTIRNYLTRNSLQEYNHVNLHCVLNDEIKLKKHNVESRIKHFMLQDNTEADRGNHNMVVNAVGIHENNKTEDSSLENVEQGNKDDIPEKISDINIELNEFDDINSKNQDIDGEISNSENAVSQTESQHKVIVRKDLFDKEKVNNKKHLSKGIVSKNGHIIIKIDRKRLQNFVKIKPKDDEFDSPEVNIEQPLPLSNSQNNIDIDLSPQTEELPSSSSQDSNNEGSTVYNCNQCNFLTADIIKIYDHNRTFHNFDYTCQYCPFSTSKVELLGKHMSMVHPTDMTQRSYKVTENFACILCPFSVKNIDLLRSHQLSAHSNQTQQGKKSAPIILNNAFRETIDIKAPHILRSTEYTCEVCHYSTKDKSNLRKHLFTHGTKPLTCEYCAYKCVSPYQLRRHVKQKHSKQCNLKTRSAPYKLPTTTDTNQFKITLESLKKESEN